MKSKYFLLACVSLVSWHANAQETYEMANIATEDLNGTARYVSMGGAMDALGADISTMNSNPAGIGLFRRSLVSVSFGLTNLPSTTPVLSSKKTIFSFDQVGIVYSMNTSYKKTSFLNIGFQYRKSRNFDQILNAANSLSGTSQNGLSHAKFNSKIIQVQNNTYDWGSNQVDRLYDSQMEFLTGTGAVDLTKNPVDATGYEFGRYSKGYIGEYALNVSGNISNRLFLGVTLDLKDVHYTGETQYVEQMKSNTISDKMGIEDYRTVTGQGVDVKVGAIARPIENSPFRLGLSISTPTWYRLKSNNTTQLVSDPKVYITTMNRFHMNTPWKFGLSAGHTIGNFLAVGVGYDYADYTAMDARIVDGYDEYGDETSYSDLQQNRHLQNTLKSVSTFKVGAELKASKNIALRAGYNRSTPMYKKSGVLGFYDNKYAVTYGNYNSSTTDYTNWGACNHFTAGAGITCDNFVFDLAWQYTRQEGQFSPFAPYNEHGNGSTDVKFSRHQLLATMSYKF